MTASCLNGIYPDFFEAAGFEPAKTERRLNDIWSTLFYGSEEERIYHEDGNDMGYIVDTGNNDARTEGVPSNIGTLQRVCVL